MPHSHPPHPHPHTTTSHPTVLLHSQLSQLTHPQLKEVSEVSQVNEVSEVGEVSQVSEMSEVGEARDGESKRDDVSGEPLRGISKRHRGEGVSEVSEVTGEVQTEREMKSRRVSGEKQEGVHHGSVGEASEVSEASLGERGE
eukprot:GHVN01022834.1.p1 GENE.GHVN01022834.1~~GHVN01022834.1.p1  ORF type:complete len:152 (+),score=104.87 GHVN01022834.1:33-458(+)